MAQSPHFFTYNSTEGLPQSQVWAAFPDSRGFLWFGTQGGGLSRFDGKQFETFTKSDGLPSDFIHCLDQDVDYRLWIGTEKGLAMYDGRQFKTVHQSAEPITCIATFPNDSIVYFGTRNGMYSLEVKAHFLKEKVVPKPIFEGTSVFSTLKTPEGLWVGTTDGLRLVHSDVSPFYGKKDGILGGGVFGIATLKNKNLLLATWGVGLIEFNPKTKKTVQLLELPNVTRPLCLFKHPDGNFWVGTQNQGLIVLDETLGSLQQITEKEGLPHNHIRAITQDAHGQVWVATSGGGVARSLRQNFTQYTLKDGLSGKRIYAIAEDLDNQLWISTSLAGLQVQDSTGFTSIPLPPIFKEIKCKTICRDNQGRMWVGTEGQGILVIEKNKVSKIESIESGLDSLGVDTIIVEEEWRFLHLNADKNLPENWVQQLILARDGSVWAAFFNRGIAQISLHSDSLFSIRHFDIIQGLETGRIAALAFDENDKLWYGSQIGTVGFFKNGKPADGFDTKNGLSAAPIRSLVFDEKNQLWIGTKGAGIYKSIDAQNTNFAPIKTPQKLGSNNIYLLLADKNGLIWAGHERGVDKIVLDKNGKPDAVFTYGRKEGFLGMETCHNAALHDRKGQLWFGTMNGLMRLLPSEESMQTYEPKVHFEEISLFYKSLDRTKYNTHVLSNGSLKDGLSFPYNQNHLSFNFRAVDLEKPERLLYRWRMDGAETEWSPASKKNSVNYVNLPPGSYSFFVQASNNGAVWSEEQTATFEILKPFWQTNAFRIASFLAIASMLVLIAWSWVRSVRRKEESRRRVLEVKNDMLQLEQKALQLQMNPHFIFNALTSIRGLITEKDFGKARSEINEFAKLMRSILNNSRRQSISLKEEIETLQQYLAIEQFCHNESFDFTINVPESINPEEVELPPMLLQPFVENAVVHGVSHLKYKGKIEVLFDTSEGLLRCRILDNGIGREKAAKLREGKRPGHQSVAMQVTKERLEALRGEGSYTSLEIKDVKSNEVGGTEVVVQLPFEEAW